MGLWGSIPVSCEVWESFAHSVRILDRFRYPKSAARDFAGSVTVARHHDHRDSRQGPSACYPRDNEVSEGEGLRVGETLEFAVAVGTTTYAIEQQIGYSGYLYWRGHSFVISELSE